MIGVTSIDICTGVAESLCSRQSRSSTCAHAQGGSSPAEERGALTTGHNINDWHGRHAKAAGTAAAATNQASTVVAPFFVDDVALGKPVPASIGTLELDGA